jgi:hypothetical protein
MKFLIKLFNSNGRVNDNLKELTLELRDINKDKGIDSEVRLTRILNNVEKVQEIISRDHGKTHSYS